MKKANLLKVIAVYDNEGKTADRYTIVFDAQAVDHPRGEVHTCLCVSHNPSYPTGVSMWGNFWADILMLPDEKVKEIGIGKKLSFMQLPFNIQQHVRSRVESDGDVLLSY